MAGEAVLVYELEPPIDFNCIDAIAIPKGSLLEIADGAPNLVTVANGDADLLAGISAEEKVSGDGKTKISVYLRGVFNVLCEGNVTVGQAWQSGVATGSANAVMVAAAGSTGAKVGGIGLETGGDGETFRVLLNIGCNGMATT